MLLIFTAILICLVSLPFIASTLIGPKIKYGEFPFRLEYEIRGQVVVVEDTIICKTDGINFDFLTPFRKWKNYLASGKELQTKFREVSLLIDDINKIGVTLDSAGYYMGLREEKYAKDGPVFDIFLFYSEYSRMPISTEKLWNEYGIRIISFEPSPPLKNNK